jgi:hypothetical protein
MYSSFSPESPKACMNLLRHIFADHVQFLQQLAPEGWAASPYVRFFHPSVEQQYAAYVRWLRRLSALDGISEVAVPQKRLSDFREDDLTAVPEREEFLNVLGLTVYDIFSDGHQVVSPRGTVYSLGSARGSGKFMADFFTYELEGLSKSYDYLDFYMGSVWVNQRADLRPFYRYVFDRLRQQRLDWIYHFPHLYLLDFRQQTDQFIESVYYDPEVSLRDELYRLELEQQQTHFQAQIDDAYEQAWEAAKRTPLVPLVAAYREVYGTIPQGHPWREA